MYACKRGRAAAVKLLLDSGADLAASNNEVTILTYALFASLEGSIRIDSHGIKWCNWCTVGL